MSKQTATTLVNQFMANPGLPTQWPRVDKLDFASGLLARAIQHEVDHLNGILFIDRMNSAAKAALSSRLKRLQKQTKRGKRIRPQDEQALVGETL